MPMILAGIRIGVVMITGTATIAGKMGGEPEILINLYKDIIKQDNPKINVEVKRIALHFCNKCYIYNLYLSYLITCFL